MLFDKEVGANPKKKRLKKELYFWFWIWTSCPNKLSQCLRDFSLNTMLLPHVHCDATYKLNWNCYPVILLGTTDAAKTFYLYGTAFCKSEKDEGYAFAFNAVKKAVLEFHDADFKPKYLVADVAQAISNGF
ncbi:hypothetical protein BpHYR1_035968 [Brachionus plicatilis]|uniref:MULE transposase domain-containing protein n=1 Tax=Brachionus plicatilis TaxID=10195 RepID=A0A3M7QSC6_BRAPC|nr:hypothetical protein BpHYR1_035968 [Brachionus plicatilis]